MQHVTDHQFLFINLLLANTVHTHAHTQTNTHTLCADTHTQISVTVHSKSSVFQLHFIYIPFALNLV